MKPVVADATIIAAARNLLARKNTFGSNNKAAVMKFFNHTQRWLNAGKPKNSQLYTNVVYHLGQVRGRKLTTH